MPRQRLRLEGSRPMTAAGRLLVILFGAALAYYGAMLVLLAFKVSPSVVNDLCGYRTAFDYLSGLGAGDISSSDRLLVAIVAVAVALLALALVWFGRPRPHLARHEVRVAETDHGVTEIQPRALERAVEAAALEHPAVVGARARYGDQAIALAVTAGGAADLVTTLGEVEDRAHQSLERHQLDLDRVDVTLAGYSSNNGRELQ